MDAVPTVFDETKRSQPRAPRRTAVKRIAESVEWSSRHVPGEAKHRPKHSFKDFDSVVSVPQSGFIRIDSILFMDSPIDKCFRHCPAARIQQRFKKDFGL
ncbi:hypothetical protein HPB50_002440 [Hyalomma asiaticum]|uniref:Uncharacterized protein n=1 Tax=Hyalomma asiaticum TaxID=266040 RepID=A0ACB7SD75_HYAAI|nr:hypothetical protein HPB50_002440 [Hyalomma asiaticum]